MVIFKNVRTAVQKFRSWRAQKKSAKDTLGTGQRKKYYRLAETSRRDFLAACGRALIIPGIVLAGGIPLTYHLLARKSKTRGGVTPSQNKNIELKEMALKVLEESRKSMSQRYQTFIIKVMELIKENKIHFAVSEKKNEMSRYQSPNNTLIISQEDFNNKTLLRLNSVIIHELFHAYQDHLKVSTRKSTSEAEAHFAECDYLYHHNQLRFETWLHTETHPYKDGSMRTMFGVPSSIVRKMKEASFSSPEYKQTIRRIGYYYIWMLAFRQFYGEIYRLRTPLRNRLLWMPKNQIENLRERYLRRIQSHPNKRGFKISNKDGKNTYNVTKSIIYFVTTSRRLADIAWKNGQEDKAQAIINETFEALISLPRSSVNISILDIPGHFDGID